MSKRYLQWGYDSFKDTKTGEISDNHIHLLNKQAEQISELEAKLAQAKMNESFEKEKKENAFKFIEELKQQLAEKDKAIENWQTMYESVVQTCHNDKEEIERLNKLFAEKEKEIHWKNCDMAGAEATIEELKIKIIDLNQDKISFALEQLEKVKELLYPELRFDYSLYLRVTHKIDNQINQLKEG